MIVIHEFNQFIRVETPLGSGYAVFIEGGAQDYFWTVGLDNGAIVSFTQDRIRLSRSYSHRRNMTDEQMKKIIEK